MFVWSYFETEIPNEILVTLVIEVSKLSTSRQISWSECTFGQEGFTQVAQYKSLQMQS